MENELTLEYLMENIASEEPKFYPCRMNISFNGKVRITILAPTLFESREQFLAYKRKTIEVFMRTRLSKQKQLEMYWELIFEIRDEIGKRDEEKSQLLQGLCLFIGTSRATAEGEEILGCNYWTKQLNMDGFEADGKNCSLCAGCNAKKKLEELNKCAGCKHVCYCSRECQKKHWKTHKKECHI
jgi:hypothetical protein